MRDHVIGVHRQYDLHRGLAAREQLLAVCIIGEKRLEIWLQRLELVLALFPMRSVAAGQQGGDGDHVAWIEIRRRKLAFQFRLPQVVPALEFHVAYQVGTIANSVDVGPGAEMKRTDSRLVGQIAGVRNFAKIELLE